MTAPILAAQIRREMLPGGLVCLVRPAAGTGAAAVHAHVRAGAVFDSGMPGLARFAGSVLIRGTRRRTGPRLAEDLDAIGASLSVAPGVETTVVTGRSLADDLPVLLDAMAEVLAEPAFPPDEVEKVRGELITTERVNALDTRQVAERLFRRLAYPDGHPHAQCPDGEEQVLASLSPGDLRAFHEDRYRSGAAIVAIAGDVDQQRAVDMAAAAFDRWRPAGGWEMPRFEVPTPPSGIRRAETVVPGKTQSDLVLGVPGVARGDPGYYGVMMANLLLGQLGMMGRIGQNVREQQGMAYYAFSDLRAGLLAGPWWVRAGVNPANLDRAIAAIAREIEELQAAGPGDDELADARTFLTGSLAVRLETTQGVAEMLANIELFGLGLDYIERYPSIIEGVTRDEVVSAIRRFPLDAYTLAVAGPERQPDRRP